MKRETFLETVAGTAINREIVDKVQQAYGTILPAEVQKILSISPQGEFIDGANFCRLLSAKEILNASAELHVDFTKHGFIPVFDIEDNNFVVFDFKNGSWKNFNIVDEVPYGGQSSLDAII